MNEWTENKTCVHYILGLGTESIGQRYILGVRMEFYGVLQLELV